MIDYNTSLVNTKTQFSTWKKSVNRIVPEAWPKIKPKFYFTKDDVVFTIGSCFARNIEKHLKKAGCSVPTFYFGVPKDEWKFRRNGILNKYTPASIFQDISWAAENYSFGKFNPKSCSKFMYLCDDGQVIDTNLGGFIPVSSERFYQRRKEICKIYMNLFKAECIVITLGLIETWFDNKEKYYIQTAPIQRYINDKDRFLFETLTYNKCFKFIQDSFDIIIKINPNAKFLITTSPVPLERTFSNQDVITANLQSKSVLRAVCGELVSQNENVDYFPSFESVMLTKSWDIWMEDYRHVSDEFVFKIVSNLIELYFK